MKPIFEFEFKGKKNGKPIVVQQSAFSVKDAKRRIKNKIKDVEIGKTKRKLSYPHSEGGRKIK